MEKLYALGQETRVQWRRWRGRRDHCTQLGAARSPALAPATPSTASLTAAGMSPTTLCFSPFFFLSLSPSHASSNVPPQLWHAQEHRGALLPAVHPLPFLG